MTSVGVSVADRNGVRVITIDRPAVRNAIDVTAGRAIDAALCELDRRPELRVGILTGAGGTFSAGKDIKAATAGRPEAIFDDRGFAGLTRAALRTPLIAAVEGLALGGGFELVLSCDLVVASASAEFGLPEVSRGLVASEGGMVRLPRRLPPAIAAELLLTGDRLPAQRAVDLGLVNRLVPPGEALPAATELAARIVRNAPLAVATVIRVLRECATRPEPEAFQLQDRLVAPVFASPDAAEGLLAFTERRAPVWRCC